MRKQRSDKRSALKLIELCMTVVIIIGSLIVFRSETFAAPSEYDRIMLEKINEYRKTNGIPALEYNKDLARVADLRVGELTVSFSHFRPNGDSYKTAYTELGIADKFDRGSENIARVLDNWDFEKGTAEEYVDYIFEAYKRSESHNANMLKPYWTYYGGSFLTNYNGNCYQIQVFAN